MEPGYYRDGNYIYECKSSPDRKDGPLNNNSLNNWVRDVKQILKKYQPSGFRYIFPVNRVDSQNQALLEKLQREFPNIDIQYYDCDSVENLIKNLKRVNTLPELVSYIEAARR